MRGAVEKITARFEELLTAFEGFVEIAMTSNGPVVLGEDEVWRHLVSALQTIRIVCSETSPHYAAFKMLTDDHLSGEPLKLRACIDVLHAAGDDLRSGMLGDISGLIAADVFGDLLDMAAYLLEQKYHLPAAAIAGAVLEDTLRQLCKKHQVTWVGDSSISKLNAELYKATILDKVQMGNVEAWGKLRNKVDLGDFKPSEVSANDVGRMINGV